MKLFKFKKLIPNGNKETIEIVKLWKVTWVTYGAFNSDREVQCEYCTNEEDAKKLGQQIKAAYQLIKSPFSPEVKIIKYT